MPLRKSFFQQLNKKIFNNNKPTLFFIGGKQGSHIINCSVENILPEIIKEFNVVHQTGNLEKTGDYLRLKKFKESLPKEQQTRYLIKTYFFEDEIANLINSADLMISRAGAHIIYELAVLAKPAILIPIPWSYQHEQDHNAEILIKIGSAMMIKEKELTGKLLLNTIKVCMKNLTKLKKQAELSQELTQQDASEKMVNYIEKELAPVN